MLQWELPLCERDKGSERLIKCHCHACQWGWRLLTSPLGSGSTLCLFPFKNIFAALAPGFHPLNILAGAQCHLLKTIRPFTWFVVLTVCSHILCLFLHGSLKTCADSYHRYRRFSWQLSDYVSPQSRHQYFTRWLAVCFCACLLPDWLSFWVAVSRLKALDRLFDSLTSSLMFLKRIIGWIDLCSSCPYGEWYSLAPVSLSFSACQTQQSSPRTSLLPLNMSFFYPSWFIFCSSLSSLHERFNFFLFSLLVDALAVWKTHPVRAVHLRRRG